MFIKAQDVMQLSTADEAQATRLADHCAVSINAQRNDNPELKSFVVNTKDFSKSEKDNDDKDITGLSVKVRVEVEARAKDEGGWKVAFDEKTRTMTFTPKRKYSKKAPVVVIEPPAENEAA